MRGIGLSLLLVLLVTGCQAAEKDIKSLQLEDHSIVDQHYSDEAKKVILSMKEVTEVKGVNDENKIYLAPTVKHFDRFRLKEIRKAGHDSVKKRFPNATVHLSTDKKVFIELGKLEQQLKQKQISKKHFKEKLKKMEEMMKG
ncbi:hypothetical protein GN156_09625 [bacterium LRH843]|nr:hypothetical protein [bacterium LRH843]